MKNEYNSLTSRQKIILDWLMKINLWEQLWFLAEIFLNIYLNMNEFYV